MKIAREAQIKQKEHFQAVQAERERQVFERILQSHIEEVSLSPKKDGLSDCTIRLGAVKLRCLKKWSSQGSFESTK